MNIAYYYVAPLFEIVFVLHVGEVLTVKSVYKSLKSISFLSVYYFRHESSSLIVVPIVPVISFKSFPPPAFSSNFSLDAPQKASKIVPELVGSTYERLGCPKAAKMYVWRLQK